MSETSGDQFPVGLQYACVFELNTAGRPRALTSAAYGGIEIKGPKVWTFTAPKPVKKTHLGNNRVKATDYLPSQDSAESELKASVYDYPLLALLGGVKTFAIGEAMAMAQITDKQGKEPDVAIHLFQQSLDLATGTRRWRNVLIPSARCIAQLAGMSADPEDVTYSIAMNPVATQFWGTTLTELLEGALEETYLEFMSEGQGRFESFLGDGTVVEFTFPAGMTAMSVAKIAVWDNGVLKTTGVTKTTDKVTFTTAPLVNHDIVVFLETE